MKSKADPVRQNGMIYNKVTKAAVTERLQYRYCTMRNFCWLSNHRSGGLQDNSPTNQLAVSQVADWITRGLVDSPTANF